MPNPQHDTRGPWRRVWYTAPMRALTAIFALTAIVALTASLPANADETAVAKDPMSIISEASNDLLALIEEARGYAEEDPDRFFRQVEASLQPVVDFDGFARSVMASYYKRATPEQQQRFAETFKWGLVRTYALALLEYGGGRPVVVPPDRPPRSEKRQSVNMEIRMDSGEVYELVYSMAQYKDGNWRIRNIIIEGVNMGLTYRNQFASAVQDGQYGGDLDGVIDAWGEILSAEPDDEADATSGKDSGKDSGRGDSSAGARADQGSGKVEPNA